MSLRDELLQIGLPFDVIPSIRGKFGGEKWEITGSTTDGRPVRHIRSVTKPETAEIKPTDNFAVTIAKANLTTFVKGKPLVEEDLMRTALLGPGIELDFTDASPSFNVDRETGDIVGIWALVKEAS